MSLTPLPNAIEHAEPGGDLDEADLVADRVVVVDRPAERRAVELLGPVHVAHGHPDQLDPVVHHRRLLHSLNVPSGTDGRGPIRNVSFPDPSPVAAALERWKDVWSLTRPDFAMSHLSWKTFTWALGLRAEVAVDDDRLTVGPQGPLQGLDADPGVADLEAQQPVGL